MGFLSRILYPFRSVRREVVTLSGTVVLGASGAIAANGQDPLKDAGFALAKVGGKSGRYTVTIQGGSKVARLVDFDVKLIGVADAAFTAARALIFQARNDNVATAGTFDIQGINPADSADAEIEDNLTMKVTIQVALV